MIYLISIIIYIVKRLRRSLKYSFIYSLLIKLFLLYLRNIFINILIIIGFTYYSFLSLTYINIDYILS